MTKLTASTYAEKLLSEQLGDTDELPIDVRKLACNVGIRVIEDRLPDEISAMLLLKSGKFVVVLNEDHVPTRKRFSLAHELGHFCLHRMNFDLLSKTEESQIMFRDATSSRGISSVEIEANAFAASLLMPEPLFRQAWDEMPDAGKIAQLFEVSPEAAEYRRAALGLNV